MAKKKTTAVADPPQEDLPTSDSNGHALEENAPVVAPPSAKKQPAFKVGPIPTGKGESVAGCVWENEHVMADGRTYTVHSIVLDLSYFNEAERQWKPSKGIRPSQLAAVEYVLRQCGDFAFRRRDVNQACPI